MIYFVCRKFGGQLSKEELEYHGRMALFYCLGQHDFAGNTKFTTSLWRHVTWQCLSGIRNSKQLTTIPLPIDHPQRNISLLDRICVLDCMESLPDKHRVILRSYFYEGKTLREIGMENGFSRIATWRKLELAKEAFQISYGNE